MESPVCTPIGSRFSIEQMITQLSARSRMTSSSYSFQPGDRLLDEDLGDGAGLEADGGQPLELLGVDGDAGALAPEDVGGRMMTGRPMTSAMTGGPRRWVWAMPDGGTDRPISIIACLNFSRSSAVAMASALAPMSSTP
jgi:hypothetical protein